MKEVILTQKLIDALKTDRGGFTGATLRAIGIKPYPPKGWTYRLRGTSVTEEQYQQALEGRNILLQKKRPKTIQGPLLKETCVKCGQREVYQHTDSCEECLWDLIKDDQHLCFLL